LEVFAVSVERKVFEAAAAGPGFAVLAVSMSVLLMGSVDIAPRSKLPIRT
jgi:hypothetical protein